MYKKRHNWTPSDVKVTLSVFETERYISFYHYLDTPCIPFLNLYIRHESEYQIKEYAKIDVCREKEFNSIH